MQQRGRGGGRGGGGDGGGGGSCVALSGWEVVAAWWRSGVHGEGDVEVKEEKEQEKRVEAVVVVVKTQPRVTHCAWSMNKMECEFGNIELANGHHIVGLLEGQCSFLFF